MLSVALILHLTVKGFDQWHIGTLFTYILIGDIIITLLLTTTADAFGRRNILVIGSILKLFAGLMFAFVDQYLLLVFAGIVGIISPSGGEIGPFLSIEQACMTENVKDNTQITAIYSWYNFFGYLSTALGALSSGYMISKLIKDYNFDTVNAYRSIIIAYAIFGAIKTLIYLCLSRQVETAALFDSELIEHATDSTSRRKTTIQTTHILHWFKNKFGLRRSTSRRTVAKLCALFVIDAIGGGFVMQSMIIYWFHERFQMNIEMLGLMMMFANLISGVSAIFVTPLVGRIGAINTMVITHIPSNIMLILITFMQTKASAIAMLLLRFSISQMDVPARQTFVAISVENNERSAAGGITNLVRSVGLSISPIIVGYLLQDSKNPILFASPFVIGGGLKLLYDILLYVSFDVSNRNQLVHAKKHTQNI
ncbi:unnamed protein product [Rotaria socialis]|uniref:Major facilitator superfamily (MFS) profile domain-containing protein n=1 Tax=Rotaria socialis TaxID=392032 RepID=A0A820Z639_9BILA|nr:unnamed protein product [Rotaria socialis]CAF4559840.1 unnamed protein product [Rotaria socialis]